MGTVEIRLETVLSAKPNPTGKNVARVTVTPPESGPRLPTVVISMLDISGSMDTEASLPNDTTGETQGFSRLDLVKHSMFTVKEVLDKDDYLAIVTFSDKARTDLPLTRMDAAGRKLAGDRIEGLRTEGSTNIWDALRVGIETTTDPVCRDKNVVLLLLTDGEPNVHPPKGLIPTLKETLEKVGKGAEKFSIHTFGFGYSLDTLLLFDISTLGRGSYGFIPDCSMVGTIFINFMANILTTVVPSARLRFNSKNVVKTYRALGADDVKQGVIHLGPLQYGQSKTFLFELSKLDRSSFSVSFESDVKTSVSATTSEGGDDPLAIESYAVGLLIGKLLELGRISQFSPNFSDKLKAVQKEIKSLPATPFIEALLRDIESPSENEGQILKAVSKSDWYDRWGQDHLLYTAQAHMLQQCINFKDPSLQLFGGEQFKRVQDEVNTVFCNLPPPKPSGHRDNSAATLTNMVAFANPYGGCFDGEGMVLLADGKSTKLVKELVKGDRIASLDGNAATVVALVETVLPDGNETEVVEVGGVLLTPWHPVRTDGKWAFPAELQASTKENLRAIYNLVLDSHHVVKINGIEAITLGHDKTEGILAHPYFGSRKVVDDLAKHPGWEGGHLVIVDPKTERDAAGLICRFF